MAGKENTHGTMTIGHTITGTSPDSRGNRISRDELQSLFEQWGAPELFTGAREQGIVLRPGPLLLDENKSPGKDAS